MAPGRDLELPADQEGWLPVWLGIRPNCPSLCLWGLVSWGKGRALGVTSAQEPIGEEERLLALELALLFL